MLIIIIIFLKASLERERESKREFQEGGIISGYQDSHRDAREKKVLASFLFISCKLKKHKENDTRRKI